MRLAALLLGGGVWLVLGAAPRSARAFEREWHLGAAAGLAGGDGLRLAPAVGVYGAYGISDVFDVRLELTARGYRLSEAQDPYALSAMAGLVYKVDILRWVPWVGVYAGYLTFLQAPRQELTFKQLDVALGIGVGLDYAFSRNVGCGVTLRADDALTSTSTSASSFESLLRLEYRWGW